VAKIINFPGGKTVEHHIETQELAQPRLAVQSQKNGKVHKVFKRVFDVLSGLFILILGILWTPIEWLLYLDCFIQLIRAIYYWNTPGVHAWLTFFLHFGGVVTLTLFIMSKTKRPVKNFSR